MDADCLSNLLSLLLHLQRCTNMHFVCKTTFFLHLRDGFIQKTAVALILLCQLWIFQAGGNIRSGLDHVLKKIIFVTYLSIHIDPLSCTFIAQFLQLLCGRIVYMIHQPCRCLLRRINVFQRHAGKNFLLQFQALAKRHWNILCQAHIDHMLCPCKITIPFQFHNIFRKRNR